MLLSSLIRIEIGIFHLKDIFLSTISKIMNIQYIKKIIWCIIKLEWESDIMIKAINIEKVESGMLLG